MENGSTGKTIAVIAAALGAMMLAGVVMFMFFRTEKMSAEEEERIAAAVAESSESETVIETLRALRIMQLSHHLDHGEYAIGLQWLSDYGGVTTDVLNADNPERAAYGYTFRGLKKYFDGEVNTETDFVIVAQPARYGETGTLTYAIGPKGILLANDLGGELVDNISQVESSWAHIRTFDDQAP